MGSGIALTALIVITGYQDRNDQADTEIEEQIRREQVQLLYDEFTPDIAIPPEAGDPDTYFTYRAMQEDIVITDTKSYQEALEAGQLREAEDWLASIKKKGSYDERSIDHRERELFQAYCQRGMWVDAKRVVEFSIVPDSKTGRMIRLAELVKKPYRHI